MVGARGKEGLRLAEQRSGEEDNGGCTVAISTTPSTSSFPCIYVSKNQDFRNRAFAFLFTDGASEELSALQAVEAYAFAQHFSQMKKNSQVQLPFDRCKEILG